MRFLANENIPLASINLLRDTDHDVAAILSDSPGINGRAVLHRAINEDRIILTFDSDYCEMIFKHKQFRCPGLVFLRFEPVIPEETAQILLKLLEIPRISLEDRITVIERDKIRQRLFVSDK